jgi:hypothetical protein
MWMLNYPFPYEEQTVIEKYNAYAGAFYNWLLNINSRESDLNESEKLWLLDMLRYRTELVNVIKSSNYAYMSFQHWQEGVARYTEYKYLELVKDRVPYPGISSLYDFISYDSLLNKQWNRLLTNLSNPQLAEKKRVMFYYTGMAEALLLDKLAPGWRDKYLTEKFFLFEYY